ncbi:multidrug resistance-associated ABC transporter [Irpex rosettiformis]|uniref:Multidrug resistance-associated ABC transporter n=1 Tax=Irpex rosettiformis TaxID=378272 RepID=A0ACB8TUF4_9APHY|nr:multidrug resistance-associated ABC transporter [Irpex rosettiformis]
MTEWQLVPDNKPLTSILGVHVYYLPWIGLATSVLLLGVLAVVTGFTRPAQVQAEPKAHPGTLTAIKWYNIIRLGLCVALFGLQLAILSQHYTRLSEALFTLYGYCSLLAIGAIPPTRANAKVYNWHLTLLLLISWFIFAYRNIWPLATYELLPKDLAEGPLMWITGAVLTLNAAIIPLISPRIYVPRKLQAVDEKPNPEQTASLLSRLTFDYMNPMVFHAYRSEKFKGEDIPPLCDGDDAEVLIERAYKELDPLQNDSRRHLFFRILKVFMWEHIEELFLLVIMVLADFLQPVGVNRLLTYVESHGNGAYVHPWVWCLCLFIGQTGVSLISGRYMLQIGRIIARTQGVLTQLIFDHALRVRAFNTHSEASPSSVEQANIEAINGRDVQESTDADAVVSDPPANESSDHDRNAITNSTSNAVTKRQAVSLGTLNNLIATDISNIDGGQYWILTGFYTPTQIVVSIAFLYVVLGWSSLVGVVTLSILLPLPGFIANYSHSIQVERMKKSDTRVETVTEVMGSAIRMVKLFGWEKRMSARIDQQRREEVRVLRKYKLFGMMSNLSNSLILIAAMVATFVTFTIVMRRELTASRVFSSITVFQGLQQHMKGISDQLPGLIDAKVSLDRIDNFLRNSDLVNPAPEPHAPEPETEDEVVGFRDASFTWDGNNTTKNTRKFKLSIEGKIAFRRGKINLITGQSGSGKTSMLMALLGEMYYHPSSPESFVKLPRLGGVAYQAQESWILNETIRDNILFGLPYEESRYKEVLRQCALESDLALFQAGDLTEVGERGVTLSGGQKARVTFARAVYSNAAVLLLDDVFAALDTHTSKWIVDQCLQGELLRGRTIILATHSLALLTPVAHFVVSLNPDGSINSQGTLKRVLEKEAALVLAEADNDSELADESEKAEAQLSKSTGSGTEDGKLVTEEETAEGHVGWSALQLLLRNMAASPSGLVVFWVSFLVPCIGAHSSTILYTWVLGLWARQYEEKNPQDVNVIYYLSIYLAAVALNVTSYAVKVIAFTFGSLRASQVLHRLLVDSVLRSTLRWLDKTPTSRIIARCTQDISSIDGPVSGNFLALIDITTILVLRFTAIIVMSPIYTVPSILIGIVGGWVGQLYMMAQLAVKREMSNARSPILGHFGATVAGIVSVRAYGAQAAFHLESMKRVNRWVRAARTYSSLNKWVAIRSEILSAVFNAGLAAYLVYGSSLDASAIGFTLSMSVVFSNLIQWWVRYFNEFEISGNRQAFIFLERIQQYLNIEHEPAASSQGVPPAYWPASGTLRVESLSARYSETGSDVLNGISFEIRSGERVGIVGRTGSGKSSLTLALLRCLFTEGKVYFDGIDTATINLDALRSAITIIPQVPELLSGTLRENIDPFSEHDDAYLNEMLKAAGLFSLNRDKFGEHLTLDSKLSSAGKNLSVGQRQMIALARAMVRRSRLLILDEATSAIDYETDAIIQESLRQEVAKDVSVLTVAHRLHTVMDSDKIMVLDGGRIIEFGRPQELLQLVNGALRAMVDASSDREGLLARIG